MKIPKELVLDFIGGDVDAVAVAYQQLPILVDTDRDADLLLKYGVDPVQLHSEFNGG